METRCSRRISVQRRRALECSGWRSAHHGDLQRNHHPVRRVARRAALEQFRHMCAEGGRVRLGRFRHFLPVGVQGNDSQLPIAGKIADNRFAFGGWPDGECVVGQPSINNANGRVPRSLWPAAIARLKTKRRGSWPDKREVRRFNRFCRPEERKLDFLRREFRRNRR